MHILNGDKYFFGGLWGKVPAGFAERVKKSFTGIPI